jgi:hypothetical protein
MTSTKDLNFFQTNDIVSKPDHFRLLQDPTGSPPVDILAVHGISLMICWGLLMFFGYCAARYLKHYKWWLYIHVAASIMPAYWSFGMLIATLTIRKYKP